MSGDDDPGGLVARLRAWLGSLFGGGADERTPAPAETRDTTPAASADSSSPGGDPTPATHVCTVCGTEVAEPAGGCPLCGSTDVRERGAASEGAVADSPDPSPAATASESTVDGEASRLRELRDGSSDERATAGEGESDPE